MVMSLTAFDELQCNHLSVREGSAMVAKQLVHEMCREGLPPDVINGSAAISICDKGGWWQRVAAFLDEMRV
eukprot:10969301-Karenia_brevis.AAC.1